jgi:hypothetical protein
MGAEAAAAGEDTSAGTKGAKEREAQPGGRPCLAWGSGGGGGHRHGELEDEASFALRIFTTV